MQMTSEYFTQTAARILCCLCGAAIEPNPSNMCVNCIRGQIDITDGIPKQLTIFFCGHCGRYLSPPDTWVFAEAESKELLGYLLKRLKGLAKVKLVDANFVWTEPHSKRIKLKITVQQEVFTSTILQQVFIVEFTVQNQQCKDCAASFTDHTWVAVVQVRQKAEHKRTFLYLEQLILKYSAHLQTKRIQEMPDGLDFYFGHKSHAAKFVDFLQQVVPIRYKTSEKLISSDVKSNIFNFHYSFSVEIAPICRDDLVCLPRAVAQTLGNVSPFLLCTKVTNVLHFLDVNTLQGGEMMASVFWQTPFRSIAGHAQMIEYIVLDISPLGPTRGKFVLADVMVARARDFGHNDIQFYARTHLGHILRAGDTALGYDIKSGNFNDLDVTSMHGKELPDVILVRKTYPERRQIKNSRHWVLKTLEKEEQEGLRRNDLAKAEHDMEQFLRDLEEDPDYRANINLYKAPGATVKPKAMEEDDGDADDFPEPDINELIEDIQEMKLEM